MSKKQVGYAIKVVGKQQFLRIDNYTSHYTPNEVLMKIYLRRGVAETRRLQEEYITKLQLEIIQVHITIVRT